MTTDVENQDYTETETPLINRNKCFTDYSLSKKGNVLVFRSKNIFQRSHSVVPIDNIIYYEFKKLPNEIEIAIFLFIFYFSFQVHFVLSMIVGALMFVYLTYATLTTYLIVHTKVGDIEIKGILQNDLDLDALIFNKPTQKTNL